MTCNEVKAGPSNASREKRTHAQKNLLFSLDHLVGAAEQRQRNGDAERLSRLEINNHFNFCGLLNWKLRRLCAMKNLADIDASWTICVDEIGAITDQTASPSEVAKFGASRFPRWGFLGPIPKRSM